MMTAAGNVVFVTVYDYHRDLRLFRSTDAGNTFNEQDRDPTGYMVAAWWIPFTVARWSDRCGVYRSTNSGTLDLNDGLSFHSRVYT